MFLGDFYSTAKGYHIKYLWNLNFSMFHYILNFYYYFIEFYFLNFIPVQNFLVWIYDLIDYFFELNHRFDNQSNYFKICLSYMYFCMKSSVNVDSAGHNSNLLKCWDYYLNFSFHGFENSINYFKHQNFPH